MALFYECTGLASLTIPKQVASIGTSAFYGCSNLTEVHFQGDAPTRETSAFEGADKVTFYYERGTKGWESTLHAHSTVESSSP